MPRYFKSRFASRAALTGIALLSTPLGSAALAQNANEPSPRIVVSGEGQSAIAPDMAILSLSVLRQGPTAREALDANNAAMGEVLSALRAAGLEERDLQTGSFAIMPRYENNRSSSSEMKIVGYNVSNTLTVRVRDLANLGAIIDQSVSLGVNDGGQIMFTNDDPSAAIEEARIAAVKEARRKADVLAEASGVKVGQVLEISEQSYRPSPQPMMRAEMSMASDASVPIASGENTYSVTVNVTFSINQ